MDLNGKIVLVAGGAGGIGLGIAKALAAEGCKVALADANEEALVKAAKAGGGDTAFVWRTCDITEREQVSQLFQWLGEKLGPIDILVNSAGINIANRMMSNIDPAASGYASKRFGTNRQYCISGGQMLDAFGRFAILRVEVCHECSWDFCQPGGMRKRYQGNEHLSG